MEQIVFLLAAIVGLEHCIHNSVNVFAREPLAKTSSPILKFVPGPIKTKPLQEDVKNDLHKSKVSELLLAESYHTGYDNKSSSTSNSYSSTPLDIVQEKIDSAYKRVKCGYMFNAKMHLLLTGDLLEQKHAGFLRELPNPNDLLYDKEVIAMMSSLMPICESQMNELWLLYMYSNTAKNYFQSARLADGHGANVERKAVRDMHKFAINYLEEFTDTYCEKGNAFDIKSENCTIGVELREARKTGDLNSMLSVVVANKMELNKHLGLNVLKGLSSEFATGFKHDDLYFQHKFLDKDTLGKMISTFTSSSIDNTDLESVHQHLATVDKEARAVGLDGLKSLGVYQRSVMDLLKAIILNITWKHLLYLDGLSNNEKFTGYVEIYNLHLADVSELLSIKNDSFMRNIIRKFSNLNVTNFKVNFSTIVKQIKAESDVICDRLQLKLNGPSDLDSDTNSESFDKTKRFAINNIGSDYYRRQYYFEGIKRAPILDTIFAIDVLKGFLRNKFSRGFSFKTIDSFNRMTEDLIKKQKNVYMLKKKLMIENV